MTPGNAADALHERLFTIDTHSDTPTASFARDGWDFAARHDPIADDSQIDLPRMRAGGVDAMVFAVYVPQAARTPEGHAAVHELALRHLERTHAILRRHGHACGLALTADDALRLKAAGQRAIFLSLENSYSLGRDPANVEKFFRLGVRMLGLTHSLNNDLADSSTDPRGAEWGGLSPIGREVVAECNRLGVVLDASHASDGVLRELLDRSTAPVILSHSDCRALCDHPRNVGDELLRALAAKGGVIQINALPISLVNAPGNRRTAAGAEMLLRYKDAVVSPEMMAAESRDYAQIAAAHPNPVVTFDDFIAHIEHAAALLGAEHVGIGCDLDGGGGYFDGLRDVADFPNITRALVARGWREPALAALWGGNTLRLLRAAQRP
jgi:membrane dipeptidase